MKTTRILGTRAVLTVAATFLLSLPRTVEAQTLPRGAAPFQVQLDNCFDAAEDVIPPAGVAPAGAYVDVPAGKRWIIEHVSANARLTAVGETLIVNVNVFVPPFVFVFGHTLPVALVGTFGPDGDLLVGALSVRMYADGGQRVQFSARRSGTGPTPACVSVAISGFLVNL